MLDLYYSMILIWCYYLVSNILLYYYNFFNGLPNEYFWLYQGPTFWLLFIVAIQPWSYHLKSHNSIKLIEFFLCQSCLKKVFLKFLSRSNFQTSTFLDVAFKWKHSQKIKHFSRNKNCLVLFSHLSFIDFEINFN